MWNMQSGIKRKTFDVGPCPPEVTHKFRSSGKKGDRCITGLASDALNRLVIASTLDGVVHVSPHRQENFPLFNEESIVLRFPFSKTSR